MSDPLYARIAEALKWTRAEVFSVSLPSLRELLRTVNSKLAHEVDLCMRCLTGPKEVLPWVR